MVDHDLGSVRLPRAPTSFPGQDLDLPPQPAPTLGTPTYEWGAGSGSRPSVQDLREREVGDESHQTPHLSRAPTSTSPPEPSGRSSRPALPTPRSPLAGIRVLNLGVGAVVPELAALMALLGAEVIKIESTRYLDF